MPWEENTAPSALPWDKPAATPATRTPAPGTPATRTPVPGTPVEQPPGTPAVRTPLPWDNKTSDTPQVNIYQVLIKGFIRCACSKKRKRNWELTAHICSPELSEKHTNARPIVSLGHKIE